MSNLKDQAEELKTKGNLALQKGNIDEAIQFYSDGIKNDPESAALFSNRSAAYCKAKKFQEALTDAETAIQLNPNWAKGHSRKGAALAFMNRQEEALMAYEDALKFDPDSEQIKTAIANCKSHLTGPAGSMPISNYPFADPNLFQKLENDSRTKEFLKDPGYRSIMEKLQKDKSALTQHMQDSRVMTTLGVLIGVELHMGGDQPAHNDTKTTDSTPSKSESKKDSTPEAMDTDEGDSDKKKALEEKEKGNAAYKKKEFESALLHYDNAIKLDPTNIIYRTNKSAVFFEQKKYEECIQECEQAVEVGRENRADFKLIAKALARIGKTYKEMGELEKACKYYNKSLSEHRERAIAMEVQQIEKMRKEKERLAYLDPAKSAEEKEKGNEYFKKGDYPLAVKHYTEAIKRNPDDPKIYSNRAACYTKLTAFPEALKDAEKCVSLDPKFVKGYLRKGNVLLLMKENQKASSAFQQAMELDSNCAEAVDGYRKSVMNESSDPEEIRKRAMSNPEVQGILADPAMQLILQQMQKDPKALHEHLKNPQVAKKIEKLLECGLISIR